ncbi:protein of unknown function DUF1405 [Thermaerobacter marianensis DSM 12885]|uniref:DUF1405 domain-containing protein n=1 Tax=Thermaerobacter marianensis (strain ATCC 700841 / DSM 12885 / JCM 10246 / 7p75a) TaxID=644966 RepID=E6SJK8_THEM7|nr:DUF1405 domain-containing protein [Thermaerobacter marianensis]ADU52163.1 protein of unknown function DUF1405 [Thermaerobacter marianensis DSM 12885]
MDATSRPLPTQGASAGDRPPGRFHPLRTLMDLPCNRPATWLLVAVNAVGSVWGFWWYRDQLAATPLWKWPVVPDSPTASTLFTLVLVLQLLGRRLPALEAWAYLVMIKYGLWTVVVLGGYALKTGILGPEAALLIASHAGMAIEALIYQRAYPGSLRGLAAAVAWSLFNDGADYLAGLHPTLPGPEVWNLAATAAVVLTILGAMAVYRRSAAAQRGS